MGVRAEAGRRAVPRLRRAGRRAADEPQQARHDPQRSRVGFGALLLGYHDTDGGLAYAGKVGTGFDNRTLRSLHATLVHLEQDDSPFSRGRIPGLRAVHWVQPRLVGQVAFTEWTTDGQLRHPRFHGLRDDKDPGDVVRELPN